MTTHFTNPVSTSKPLLNRCVGKNGSERISDTALQASRRIDWRFLLPDPNLEQVAYMGPPRGTLPESLRLFSASLMVIGTSQARDRSTAQYDVVVADGPSYGMLQEAAELTKPSGFLYLEVNGQFWLSRLRGHTIKQMLLERPRLCSPAACVAAVKQLGFINVQAHWHWPDFESCTKIIPLNDRRALLYAFAPGGSGVEEHLKSMLGRWLLWSGLLAQLVPCFSVMAQRGVD